MIGRLMDLAESRPILAVVALASGAALLAAIFVRISLQVALLFAVFMWLAVAAFIWWRGPSDRRAQIRRIVAVGAGAGFVATLSYDASRWALSHLDPAPYNPFEAIRVFGVLLTGAPFTEASAGVMTAGALYHLLNGTSFGVAYVLLLGGRNASLPYALVTGTAWGVGLEMMQLTIYPGWLDIRAYDEFVRVSFLGHVVYGLMLGVGTRMLLRRLASRQPPRRTPDFSQIRSG